MIFYYCQIVFCKYRFYLVHDKRPSENQAPVFRRPQSFKTLNKPLFQCFQQLSVYSAETAVAHDQNMVAGFGIFHDFGNEGIEVFADVQLAAQRREGFGDVPVHAAGVAEHLIGTFEACGQGGFHGAEFHGVGTRLEDGEDAGITDTLAQAFDGGFDGGRVVGRSRRKR